MFSIIGWIIAGLIVGAIARLLMPGRQPMSVLMTIVLGIVGAFLGGLISFMIWGRQDDVESAWPGYLLAVVGAMIVLWIVGATTRRRTLP